MRAIFVFALIFTIVFATSNWYVNTASICPVPITYRVGNLDSRFPISAEEIRAVAAKAEETWESASGRDLFVYDEDSEFTINLIYDERQQRTVTEEEWRIRLDVMQKEHQALIARIEALGVRYQSDVASYDNKREDYEAKLAAYNAQVEKYNQVGGAPPEVFASLQKEAESLNKIQKDMLALEKKLNQQIDDVNKLGEEGNAKIAIYNAEVVEYNEVFGALETFTQGDYERERINIYKFSDVEELTRVIIHEFGHALGVGHVEGEESVMYYLMTEQSSPVLSAEDISAFTAICGSTETTEAKIRQLIRNLLKNFN
jgi:Matrixin